MTDDISKPQYEPLSEAELVEIEQRLQGVAEDFPKSQAVEDVSRLIATIRALQGQVEGLRSVVDAVVHRSATVDYECVVCSCGFYWPYHWNGCPLLALGHEGALIAPEYRLEDGLPTKEG